MSKEPGGAWVGFSRFEVPTAIAREGALLGGIEATVLLVLFKLANTISQRGKHVSVTVKVPRLTSLTGLSDKSVRRALESLETRRFLETRATRKKADCQFGSNCYTLFDPENGQPLKASPSWGVCHQNDVPFFLVPTDIVKHGILARLTVSQQALYIALIIVAGRLGRSTFPAEAPMLRKLSRLSEKTFKDSMEHLVQQGLVNREGRKEYTLCDPLTREKPTRSARGAANPRNWTVEGKTALDYDTLTAQQWKLVIDACFRYKYVYSAEGWSAVTRCPFHKGSGKPTLSFNFEQGCFKCHHEGCTAQGKLSRFVKRLGRLSEQQTQEIIARCIGVELQYNRPKGEAIRTWRYFNDNGTLVKEVLFFPDGEIDERPKGRGTLLYHLPEVRGASMVLVLRQEADCDQMDELALKDADGRNVATTTGGYLAGWLPKFAVDLQGKSVVVMHSSDDGGNRFYRNVANSLDLCNISHRRVSVKPDTSMSVKELAERIGTDWLYSETENLDAEPGMMQI